MKKYCNHCGKLFTFTSHDIEYGRTSTGNYTQYVECPYCDNPQYPWRKLLNH